MTSSHYLHSQLSHIQRVCQNGGEDPRKHRGYHRLEKPDFLCCIASFIALEVGLGIVFHEKPFDMLIEHEVKG